MNQQQQETFEEQTWQEELQELADQILSLLPQSVRGFCREKAREIIAGISIAVMVVLLAYGYDLYSEMRENQAATALGTSLHAAKAEDRISGLEKLVKDYGSTDAAGQALLLLGSLYNRQGDFEKAIAYYKKAEERFGSGAVFTYAAMMGRAYLLEEKGTVKDAGTLFKEISAKENPYKAVALLDYARTARFSGDSDAALDALNKYISLKPNADNLDYVRYQIVQMAAAEAKKGDGGK